MKNIESRLVVIAAVVLFGTAQILQAQGVVSQATAPPASSLQPSPPSAVPDVGTFWLAKGPGPVPGDCPPLPCAPPGMNLPVYALGNGQYLVNDSKVDWNAVEQAAVASGTLSLGPLDSDPAPTPDYQKFMEQSFALLDTNDTAALDTNLYDALLALPDDTNSGPDLQLMFYQTNEILIKANRFDYSTETNDFALLACDSLSDPYGKPSVLRAPRTRKTGG